MAKRLFDVVFAALGLLIAAPVMLLIAIAIKVDSPGPVIFKGLRSGRQGRPFRMLKFRTMVAGAERMGGPSTGMNDPRVTRVGRMLRRYKLDELPQLLNVLRGDMSLVGPRPEMPEYTRLYTGDEKLILTVRPGITDYASVVFSRLDQHLGGCEPDRVYEQTVKPVKNRLRVRYVREQSLATDLKILVLTLCVIVRDRRGARENPRSGPGRLKAGTRMRAAGWSRLGCRRRAGSE